MTTNNEQMVISNLKGRISKILTFKNQLLVSEKGTLEDIYNAIDAFIISDKNKEHVSTLKKILKRDGQLLESTDKKYIQDHILPLISILSNKGGKKGKGNKKYE